ncbi:uncharacterized protein LOC111133135 [Crassostrea virginica]
MQGPMSLNILTLAILASLTSVTHSCYEDTFAHPGTVVGNASYISFYTNSLLVCARRCKLQRRCRSVNFDNVQGECFLNHRSPGVSDVRPDTGNHLLSYDVSSWDDSILHIGACSNHSCRADLICREEGGADYSCDPDLLCKWNEVCTSCLQGSGSIRQSLVPDYAPIGCYYAYGSNTGFQTSVNFRGGINWADIETVIRDCAAETRSRGWSYFGVEFYGECFMRNSTLEPTYQPVGAGGCAEKCAFGVGAANVLFFYQLI